MFLKQLKISNNQSIIRDISFHKGLNLIIDETPTEDKQQSGNNVGKTTVLRLVHYCFGGDGKNIYMDPEFKGKSNVAVEKFLKNNNIIITMILKEDLDDEGSLEIEVRRNFLSRSSKILEIDGEQQTVKGFQGKLKKLVFNSKHLKPTIGQIVSKNIRDEKNRVAHTLKVLNAFTRPEEYESLYLFWLGVESDTDALKQKLVRDKSLEESLINNLKREASLSQIEQSLIVVNRAIIHLDEKKNNFNVNKDYERDLHELNRIKFLINECATAISVIELRRNLINESLVELESEVSNVDEHQVRMLYKQAKVLIPQLQKSYEETIKFHNQMIENKIEYISNEIPLLESELETKKRKMSEFLDAENKLGKKLRKSGAVEDLQNIVTELNKVYEKKGQLTEQKSMFVSSMTKLDNIQEALNKINKGTMSKDKIIEERIVEFNKYFSEISYKLYGEHFILSSEKSDKGYDLEISSISGNLGAGKKKGQIAAFDLSYIQFADAQDIRCLHFVLQDQIENIHVNQIDNLLTDIVASINCQYILPVLRDKLPVDMEVKQYEAVSLSQSDKLFKI